MNIIISGQHTKIGESLETHIKQHLTDIVTKYFKDAISADVKIIKEGSSFLSEILVNEGTGNKILVKSTSREYDPYVSFNHACEKIDKQLRRYKKRITQHKKLKEKFEDEILTPEQEEDLQAQSYEKKRKERLMGQLVGAKKYVFEPLNETEIEDQKADAPAIIYEKKTDIEVLSVKDAVMKMDLLNLPALTFINPSTKMVNVVYYRKDNNISWIDTNITAWGEI